MDVRYISVIEVSSYEMEDRGRFPTGVVSSVPCPYPTQLLTQCVPTGKMTTCVGKWITELNSVYFKSIFTRYAE